MWEREIINYKLLSFCYIIVIIIIIIVLPWSRGNTGLFAEIFYNYSKKKERRKSDEISEQILRFLFLRFRETKIHSFKIAQVEKARQLSSSVAASVDA